MGCLNSKEKPNNGIQGLKEINTEEVHDVLDDSVKDLLETDRTDVISLSSPSQIASTENFGIVNDSDNPDYWYEINLSNEILFSHLKLNEMENIFPGRLFSSIIPIDISRNSHSAKVFTNNVRNNHLNFILVTATEDDFVKYNYDQLKQFYRSINLEVLYFPIKDCDIPDMQKLMEVASNVIAQLAEGNNCLIQSVSGVAMPGLVISAVLKKASIKDPLTLIRKVTSRYCTDNQAKFLGTVPVEVDQTIVFSYPHFLRAVEIEIENEIENRKLLEKSSATTFSMIDKDQSGRVTADVLYSALKGAGSTVGKDRIRDFMKSNGNRPISKDEFVGIMTG